MGDNDWDSVKDYLQTHSSEAEALQKSVHGITENPMLLDHFYEVMALAQIMKNNKNCPDTLRAWAEDPQLITALREIQTGDIPAVQKYYNYPTFLHTVSAKMGGVTEEAKSDVQDYPESDKADDVDHGHKFLETVISPDTKYARGISTLHNAGDIDEVMDLAEITKDHKNTPNASRVDQRSSDDHCLPRTASWRHARYSDVLRAGLGHA